MSDVKRGAPLDPKEGEWFDIRWNNFAPYDITVQYRGGAYFSGNGGRFHPEQISCHRPHTPLVVPELKKLHRCEVMPCVVRVTGSCDGNLNGVFFAEKRADGNYLIHGTFNSVPQFNWSTTTQLTRAECEAAGWAWPEGCEEPKRGGE